MCRSSGGSCLVKNDVLIASDRMRGATLEHEKKMYRLEDCRVKGTIGESFMVSIYVKDIGRRWAVRLFAI